MKSHIGKEAPIIPVKMMRDKFGSKQEVVKDGPELLNLKLASRNLAKAWA